MIFFVLHNQEYIVFLKKVKRNFEKKKKLTPEYRNQL